MTFYLKDRFLSSFLQNNSIAITLTLMLVSAKLKTGLKNMNCCPPQNGNQSG